MNRTVRRTVARAPLASVKAVGNLSALLVRGEKPSVDRSVVLESWKAVSDGAHNSNTDLTYWRGQYYLCHQTWPYHLGSRRSRLLLWRSEDARNWQKIAEFKAPPVGVPRPKVRPDRRTAVYLRAAQRLADGAEPLKTVYTSSLDGVTWSPISDIAPQGWLFWRPKTLDDKTWYVTAYWHEHGRSQLLKSTDGVEWETVSYIWEGERNDETDFEFMPDGRILATARLEGHGGMSGDATSSTLIAVAEPPYSQWTYAKSYVTRLDGPCLFPYNGRIYAVGRYQASFFPRVLEQGGIFSRKRTSIFLVEPHRLTRLTDLPSAGDTSYAGVAIRGDEMYVSYYMPSSPTPSGCRACSPRPISGWRVSACRRSSVSPSLLEEQPADG